MKTDEFKNPSNEYRGKPFWAWNGSLVKSELLREIDAMEEMGFGGFFMHSRVGLETEYLGDEWFELINACADYAESKGMEAWLYDEDRWPSGTAGGMITEKPENRRKYMEFADGKLNIFEMPASNFYNGYTYVDTMKRSATDDFIASTHEKYAERCGDRLGRSIKGIFTDEPHRGLVFCNTGDDKNLGKSLPYTDGMFAEFEKRFGYSLEDRLPELFAPADPHDAGKSRVKLDYMELINELFLENFMEPIHDWCGRHGMKLTGHVLHEDAPSSQSIPNGSVMRSYEHMHVPGVDVLNEGNLNFCIVKQLSSACNQLGKTELLSELYGCTGWQMNFESYKAVGLWQALLGINLRCPHLSWYTMEGEAKRDYPASILHQSTWYAEFRAIEDMFSRIHVFLSQGKPVRSTLVVSTIETLWRNIEPDWSAWLQGENDFSKKLDSDYREMCERLLARHIMFDYADEDMLARLGSVENGKLRVGEVEYENLILPDGGVFRGTTLALAEKFRCAGGKVVSDDREIPSEYSGCPDVFVEVKRCGSTTFFAILNMNRSGDVSARMELPDGRYTRWNPETGEVSECEKPVTLDLHANEIRLYSCAAPLALGNPVSAERLEDNALPLDFARLDFRGKTVTGEVLKLDRALRAELGIPFRGGEMLQPWFVRMGENPALADIKLVYSFVSDADMDAKLVVEQSERFDILVNGEKLDVSDPGRWIDICFDTFPIRVKKGENVIELSTAYKADTNIEALYVIGDFSVRDGKLTENAPISLGDFRENGLPFYTGKLRYTFESSSDVPTIVKFPDLCGCACITVESLRGGKVVGTSLVTGAPYEAKLAPCDGVAVTLVPTRRNLFGPLHNWDTYKEGCGPLCFLTEGSAWSDEYDLIAVGLK